jgi:hypothetical protein
MATNAPKGPGRKGAVKKRDQVYNPRNKRWTKLDAETELFLDQFAKKNRTFKGVRKLK